MTTSALTLHPIRSAALKAIGYDRGNQELHIQYHSGDRWAYSRFPPAAWDALWNADSRGSHFNRFVQMGGYERRKLVQ